MRILLMVSLLGVLLSIPSVVFAEASWTNPRVRPEMDSTSGETR